MINTKFKVIAAIAFVSVVLHTTPCHAFLWPTFDIAEVMNTISGYITKAKSTASTVKSTLSIGKIQQAIGDNVGSLSKFVDEKEKAEKEKLKLEKRKARADRLLKQRKKWAEDMGKLVDNIKDPYSQLKSYAKDYYSDGKELFDKGQKYYQEGQKIYDNAKKEYESAKKDYENIKKQYEAATDEERDSLQDKYLEAVQKYNEAKGKYDDIASSYTPDTGNSSGAEEFSDEDFGLDEDGFDFDEEIPEPTPAPDDMQMADEPEKTESPVKSEASDIPDFVENPDVAAVPASPAFDGDDGSDIGFNSEKDVLVNKPQDIVKPVLSVVPVAPTLNIKPKTGVVPADDEIGERRFKRNLPAVDKTEEITALYTQTSEPTAFAQLIVKDEEFKTGTTDDGKFIYSDTFATKCGMEVKDLSDKNIDACIKKWVLGMHDPNAEIAAEWRRLYKTVRHDHIANDLAVALTQKNYSANFTTVSEDLEKKAGALTNEREEISFSGNVGIVNQEIIIRLMEAMTGQVVTDSINAINYLERDYYESKEDKDNE